MAVVGEEIFNPRTGQTMIFRKTAQDSQGELLQIECYSRPHGPAEPEHIHPRQESRCEVYSGSLRFSVQGQVRTVGPGEVLVIPPGIPHYFWNDGDETAHYLQAFRPALQIERFFETLFGLARDGKLDAKGMPSLLQIAVLMPAFADELRPTSPPWPLLRTVGWLLGPLARARGYRSVYPRYQGEAAHPSAV